MLEDYKIKLEKQWLAWALIMIMTRLGNNSPLEKLCLAVASIVLIVNVVRYYRLSANQGKNKH
ncbi:hypothetical protein [Enterococcus columbae]|uniref:Uncharacterized protein n=1 Tax=Enterococcus columbae DSM 7374 = ATCC 51263 TaxID=1121865 RepID=S0KG63_9ENTE|nr:hypothetical protein [Enterococcus columbae]EOT38121.1 hypothetical protein OMW_02379 [Enterococcus columbae DSM 7374 = ATCC 51263]EOW83788.1 hypothetical protein I568_01590 [Enterococcus columbae DSM 7374 = ATCC 51263]OJG24795.1 hypothetical protein RR47_GL002151 [Enterococcus columbae DSM 7374 = ATCC 51263]